MKIKDIDIGHGICLAPMAGYTDRAMRLVCHELGADFSVTEMVSAKAVVYNDKKTFALARIRADEGPVGLQIFGSDPEIMAEAAARLIERAEEAIPTRTSPGLIFSPLIISFLSTTPTANPAMS